MRPGFLDVVVGLGGSKKLLTTVVHSAGLPTLHLFAQDWEFLFSIVNYYSIHHILFPTITIVPECAWSVTARI